MEVRKGRTDRIARKSQCERWVFDDAKWMLEEAGARRQIRSHRDLDVFNLAYTLAMEVFWVSSKFPKEERFSLTDQIRRSSRSVCSNVVEGFAKRRHAAVFKNSLNDTLGKPEKTNLWPNFALDCQYPSPDNHQRLTTGSTQVNPML